MGRQIAGSSGKRLEDLSRDFACATNKIQNSRDIAHHVCKIAIHLELACHHGGHWMKFPFEHGRKVAVGGGQHEFGSGQLLKGDRVQDPPARSVPQVQVHAERFMQNGIRPDIEEYLPLPSAGDDGGSSASSGLPDRQIAAYRALYHLRLAQPGQAAYILPSCRIREVGLSSCDCVQFHKGRRLIGLGRLTCIQREARQE